MPQAPWSASAVEARAVASLLPYAGNARTHSAEQVAQIAASILEFGFVAPVLVDEHGEIIAGHGRLQAAKSLGLETVPTITRAGLTDAQKAAYRLADNRIALNAGWDEALLAAEVAKLQEMGGLDLALTGFDAGELDRLLAGMEPVATDPGNGALASLAVASVDAPGNEAPAEDPADADPEPPRQAVTRPGDLWLLGEHRLLCGDSTDAASVARVMGEDRAVLLFTSPPYGNQRDYTTGGGTDWDVLMQGVFQHLDAAMRLDGQVLVNLGLIHRDSEWQPYWSAWLDWMRARGWRRFGLYAWDQGPGLPGDWNGRLAPAFELVFHFNRQARQANKIVPCKWAGTPNKGSGLRAADGTISEYQHAGLPVQDFRIPDNVLRLTRHKGRGIETEHPAVFPVVLPEFLMRTYTDQGDAVFEPFGGSGTTILAGQRTSRRVLSIELAPAYVDLAIARWRMLHPDMPVTLADDGRDYDAVAAAQHDIPIERPRRLAPDSFGVGAPGSLRSIIAAARPAAAVHVRLPCAARVFAHLCRATACAAPRGGFNRAILSDMAGRFHETLRSLLGPWRAEKPPLPERWRAPPPGAVLAQRYVVFDLETTGLAPSRGDRLVQIGAVRLEAGQEAASFTTLVNPGRGIPALSTRFHGITDAMVADAPSIADAVAAFAAFAGDAVLVAHNAAFDRTVLTAAEQQDATPIHNPMLCSLLLARWLQPRELDMSLDGLCGRLGIVIEGRHHALGDARATASLWLHLLGRVTASGIDELPEIAKRSRMRDGIAEGPQKF